jgi:hypothetical protein
VFAGWILMSVSVEFVAPARATRCDTTGRSLAPCR